MNSKSKVLALKYRPQTFDELIGQKVIAESIFNSIKNNKIPNAYMFLGIRGSGKTSTARIVAKSLNCENGVETLCKKEGIKILKRDFVGSNHSTVLRKVNPNLFAQTAVYLLSGA